MSVFKRDRDPYHTTQVQPTAKPSPAPSPFPAQRDSSPVSSTPLVPNATEPHPPAPPAVQRDMAAVIDKNSELTGTLHSKGNVLIEGAFHGEVEAKETVMVDKNAQTQGQLCANDVVIAGSFDGEATCQHRLQITATATVKGEIKTPILVVEEGSTVNCRFKMTRERI